MVSHRRGSFFDQPLGVILGLLVFFRRYFSKPGRWLSRLDANVYGVYLIHVFVVVGLQTAMHEFEYPALVKFGIVAVIGVVVSFGLTGLIRRIPGVARVVRAGKADWLLTGPVHRVTDRGAGMQPAEKSRPDYPTSSSAAFNHVQDWSKQNRCNAVENQHRPHVAAKDPVKNDVLVFVPSAA